MRVYDLRKGIIVFVIRPAPAAFVPLPVFLQAFFVPAAAKSHSGAVAILHVLHEALIRIQSVNGDLFAVPLFVAVLYGDGDFHKLVFPSGQVGVTAHMTVWTGIVFAVEFLYPFQDVFRDRSDVFFRHSFHLKVSLSPNISSSLQSASLSKAEVSMSSSRPFGSSISPSNSRISSSESISPVSRSTP